MKIAVFGHGNPVKLIVEALAGTTIRIVNVEQDKVRDGEEQKSFSEYLAQKDILLNHYNQLGPKEFDLIFLINYNKIIDLGQFHNLNMVNLHIGLLPKYRGTNANAWAVLNNEKVVGYTVHEVDDVLDGGDIYYKYEYSVLEHETYYDAKIAIEQNIKEVLPKLLTSIYKNELKKQSQANEEFVYCPSLRPKDGQLTSWNVTTDELFRNLYVFSKPLGSGLKFEFKGNSYEIRKMSRIDHFANSLGIPGAVVYVTGNSVWIKTKDTAVCINEIICEGKAVDMKGIFRIGNRL